MIKDISALRDRSTEFLTKFVENCTVEEKIDAYYVSVEIHTHRLLFRKANEKKINRQDMILNSMYGTLINDWQYFRMANPEWFTQHHGDRIYMFYIPSRKPIMTSYKDDIVYVIDRIISGSGKELNQEDACSICGLTHADKFGISMKETLPKSDAYVTGDIIHKIRKDDSSWISDLLSEDASAYLLSSGQPEGYIVRMGKKYIYQATSSPQTERDANTERAQYEYLLMDFIRFWDELEDVDRFNTAGDYVKTVCALFNEYINNGEKYTHKIENNIDETSLEPPCLGTRFDMGLEYVPDITTRELCTEKVLYKNIFKVLLVNLKKQKKVQHCLLMNQDKVEQWNSIVKTIKNLTNNENPGV